MREKTATFIGHNECYNVSQEILEEKITYLIENGITYFLSGGMGRFDLLCAFTVYKFKKKYPQIRNILVIPYPNFSIKDKDIFDEIIFPESLEKNYYKAAIPARNKYLVEKSSYAICYVKHGWGGAAKTYEYAKKKDVCIIDI